MVFLKYFDLVMPSVALAQGFGRIGCFLAGCCYGKETESPLGIVFHESAYAPNGVKLYSSGNFSTVNNLQLSSGTDGHHRDYAMLTQASGFDELRIMHSSGDADWGSIRFYAENGQAKVSVHSPLTVGSGLLLINLPTTTQQPNLYIDAAGNLYRCAS